MLFLNEVDNFLNGLQQPEIGIFFIQIAWMLLAVFCVQEMRSEFGKTFWNAVVYASEYMEIGHSSYIRDFVVLIFAKLAIGIHVFVLIVLST